MPLPENAVAIGVDWSGSAKAGSKIWAARIVFKHGRGVVESVDRPFFAALGPSEVVEQFAKWLAAQEFDVIGLDFCFGLQRQQMLDLELPAAGPVELGKEIRRRFRSADEFKEAVGAERKRVTDVRSGSPFAPTNLRMYRQTYWGLRALADIADPIAPWSSGSRTLVEVLPAHVARTLPGLSAYKVREASDIRREALEAIKTSFAITVPEIHVSRIAVDKEGDAIDAVLAAIAAAAALASGYSGADPAATASGEGWIYSVS